MVWCTAPMKRLYPSGDAREASDAPTVPPAPPRLSMISCLPVCLANCAPSGRANASVPPPAGNGTIIVTGLTGHAAFCARAKGAAAAAAAAANPRRTARRCMLWESMLLCLLCRGHAGLRSTVQVRDRRSHRDFTLRQQRPVLVEPLGIVQIIDHEAERLL